MTLHQAWFNLQRLGFEQSFVRQLGQLSDYVAFTHYPLPDAPDHPLWITGPDHPEWGVSALFARTLEMAGDKPVVLQEVGWPTYDVKTHDDLLRAWPDKPLEYPGRRFPEPFYPSWKGTDGVELPIGEAAQAVVVEKVFQEWQAAKLRVPLVIWFTAFELHVEGEGCSLLPEWVPDLNALYPVDVWGVDWNSLAQCNPCLPNGADDPKCHLCSATEKVDFLGLGLNDPAALRFQRFFGSCGLIRSNGVEKAAWPTLKAKTAELRVRRA